MSLRQFFYIIAGLAASYMWARLVLLLGLGLWGWLPAVIPPVFALMLAFMPIGRIGGGLDRYLFLKFVYLTQPQEYVYNRSS